MIMIRMTCRLRGVSVLGQGKLNTDCGDYVDPIASTSGDITGSDVLVFVGGLCFEVGLGVVARHPLLEVE